MEAVVGGQLTILEAVVAVLVLLVVMVLQGTRAAVGVVLGHQYLVLKLIMEGVAVALLNQAELVVLEVSAVEGQDRQQQFTKMVQTVR